MNVSRRHFIGNVGLGLTGLGFGIQSEVLAIISSDNLLVTKQKGVLQGSVP